MLITNKFFVVCFLVFSFNICNAQIEVDYANSKNFNNIGYEGFLNFSFPVAETNYVTVEGGVQYFKNQYDEELVLIPF